MAIPQDTQIQTIANYLGNFFPDMVVRPVGYEATASATIQLLDQLRAFQRKQKEENDQYSAKAAQARANTVKGAIARLTGYPEKLSTDELKRQAIEMIADDKFWRDLSTIKWAQEEMSKALGPYAY